MSTHLFITPLIVLKSDDINQADNSHEIGRQLMCQALFSLQKNKK